MKLQPLKEAYKASAIPTFQLIRTKDIEMAAKIPWPVSNETSPFFSVQFFLTNLSYMQACQSLSLYSFLMLPMQRITRLPLLTAAIISHLPSNSPELIPCKEALEVLNNLVRECNEATRHKERMEEMETISQTVDFR